MNIMFKAQEIDECSLNYESLNNSEETRKMEPKEIH